LADFPDQKNREIMQEKQSLKYLYGGLFKKESSLVLSERN